MELYSNKVNIAFDGINFALKLLEDINLNTTSLKDLINISYSYKILNNISNEDFKIFHYNYMSYILNKNYMTI